ncbi:MAG: endolytic transglycosylase MltG [Patescibacteria group bacterium]|nr:endolytic transglycosylase MltG [Patescibacteria group bacterium]
MIEELKLNKLFKIYPWLILTIIIFFIIANSLFKIFYPLYIPEPGKEVYFPPKIGIREISNKLEKEGVVRSAFFLRLYLFLLGKANKIRAGFYHFKGNLNIKDVSEILIRGGKGITITFSEGLTLVEINHLLNKNKLNINLSQYKLKDFPESELLKYFPSEAKLEGFLMPDTYEFFYEETEREIIEKFLKNFIKKALPEFLKYPENNFYEKLILASILEKEAKYIDDMKIIAGILENRLKINKKLEVDATLAYINCQIYPCNWKVNPKELRTNKSLYNTYLNFGYPPTPISNPGLNAIKASLEPIKTDYLYYITNKEGRAIFAKIFKEHQKNIQKYLKNSE